jgi:hypothetical protein
MEEGLWALVGRNYEGATLGRWGRVYAALPERSVMALPARCAYGRFLAFFAPSVKGRSEIGIFKVRHYPNVRDPLAGRRVAAYRL